MATLTYAHLPTTVPLDSWLSGNPGKLTMFLLKTRAPSKIACFGGRVYICACCSPGYSVAIVAEPNVDDFKDFLVRNRIVSLEPYIPAPPSTDPDDECECPQELCCPCCSGKPQTPTKPVCNVTTECDDIHVSVCVTVPKCKPPQGGPLSCEEISEIKQDTQAMATELKSAHNHLTDVMLSAQKVLTKVSELSDACPLSP